MTSAPWAGWLVRGTWVGCVPGDGPEQTTETLFGAEHRRSASAVVLPPTRESQEEVCVSGLCGLVGQRPTFHQPTTMVGVNFPFTDELFGA